MTDVQQIRQDTRPLRFSAWDGVLFADGRRGVVRGHDGKGCYCVVLKGPAVRSTVWVAASEVELTALPDLNDSRPRRSSCVDTQPN